MDFAYEEELNDASKFRKALGVLVASILTPAIAIFSFLFLSETAALFGLAEYAGARPLFTLEFFWMTVQLMFLGYIFTFSLIPIAIVGHLLLHSPILSKRYNIAIVMGIIAALIFGLFVYANSMNRELGFENNVWVFMLVIGGAFSGAANLFIYRRVSGDRGGI